MSGHWTMAEYELVDVGIRLYRKLLQPQGPNVEDFEVDGELEMGDDDWALAFRYLWNNDDAIVMLERFTISGSPTDISDLGTGDASAHAGYLDVEDDLSRLDWEQEIRRFHGEGGGATP